MQEKADDRFLSSVIELKNLLHKHVINEKKPAIKVDDHEAEIQTRVQNEFQGGWKV